MIDEELTFEKYGYYSTDWKPQSHKKIVAVCDGCGAIRYNIKCDYRDLCPSCAQKRKKMPPRTDEHCRNISKSKEGTLHTDETRQHMSATKQGIPYEEWDGFIKEQPYCEKFDEACRERIRAKNGFRCFVCNKHQDENITKNGKQIALSVHHYDMNKDAGCNGNEWKLIPLCMKCHPSSHFEPLKSRIVYVLDNIQE